ncbi:hypothetical protein S40293_10556 [Stachybotrys chartarum IBT 40293]|nr:hypothetical protein S40293_10556 [Stachybotrys chartarum IBT 40293]KFA80816.1 hypothetical protein S40288_10955 [Stachybotrys chartarum IBT 40288]
MASTSSDVSCILYFLPVLLCVFLCEVYARQTDNFINDLQIRLEADARRLEARLDALTTPSLPLYRVQDGYGYPGTPPPPPKSW